jgi:cell division protease FtsH
MVTEFGMSDRIGPRAWGSSGPIFLGDELTSHREYSEETTTAIDDEVERFLREGEERCRTLLGENRKALDLIAKKLLEEETVSGSEVNRLIRVAKGTEPDIPTPSTAPSTPTTPSAPSGPTAATGAETPPPLPPHLQPQPRTLRNDLPHL